MSQRRGLMLVLSSPSGAGKTTLSRKLLQQEQQDGELRMSVSVTTRPMRPKEVEAKDYFFIDTPRFETMVKKGELLEHAQVFDNYYGTPAHFVNDCLEAGTDVLFDIDWQGTRQLTAKRREDVVSIFILPPSMDELERRLRARAQDPEDVIRRRMAKAADEISHWQEYDYVIVNEDSEYALAQITVILEAERLKRPRQLAVGEFIKTLI